MWCEGTRGKEREREQKRKKIFKRRLEHITNLLNPNNWSRFFLFQHKTNSYESNTKRKGEENEPKKASKKAKRIKRKERKEGK